MVNVTEQELAAMTDTPEVVDVLHGWLERGSQVAVYRNEAFDSTRFGHRKFVSFGDAESYFLDEPPTRLPDTLNELNWAYQLEAVCRREA